MVHGTPSCETHALLTHHSAQQAEMGLHALAPDLYVSADSARGLHLRSLAPLAENAGRRRSNVPSALGCTSTALRSWSGSGGNRPQALRTCCKVCVLPPWFSAPSAQPSPDGRLASREGARRTAPQGCCSLRRSSSTSRILAARSRRCESMQACCSSILWRSSSRPSARDRRRACSALPRCLSSSTWAPSSSLARRRRASKSRCCAATLAA
mmetsp:Transcript_94423/g.293924  ORF Transcript_94423/g.293924 Transcript_94423/m.293924 type:complete len:211 (-) Transcript_94423:323-955(-)